LNRTINIASVRKTVVVQASPQMAFEVFTAGIDRWWPKSHGIGAASIRESIIEPFVGGAMVHKVRGRHGFGRRARGNLAAAERFVVTWEISPEWKPDPRVAFASEVEVRFLAEGAGRTRVELEHRNFERMGATGGETMRNSVDGGWPALLELFAIEASAGG
jgi:uncharacterized protein YndB with AHSA1/START domain